VTAFIYAAGRAARLGAAHASQPKILLEVGGRSLLEWHVLRLREVGVRRVLVVTGYLREQVACLLPVLCARYDASIEEIVNPSYSEGSVVSVQASLPRLLEESESVLLMDGDVLYPAAMLRRLVGSSHRTVLLIDRGYSADDGDPVLVPVRDGKPFEFRKQWRGVADAVGESVGFFRIAQADLALLAEETLHRTVGHGRLESYDEIIRAMVLTGRFGCEDVTGMPWIEIDYPGDVERARRVVLPEILRGESVSIRLAT
jgi:choline kinase